MAVCGLTRQPHTIARLAVPGIPAPPGADQPRPNAVATCLMCMMCMASGDIHNEMPHTACCEHKVASHHDIKATYPSLQCCTAQHCVTPCSVSYSCIPSGCASIRPCPGLAWKCLLRRTYNTLLASSNLYNMPCARPAARTPSMQRKLLGQPTLYCCNCSQLPVRNKTLALNYPQEKLLPNPAGSVAGSPVTPRLLLHTAWPTPCCSSRLLLLAWQLPAAPPAFPADHLLLHHPAQATKAPHSRPGHVWGPRRHQRRPASVRGPRRGPLCPGRGQGWWAVVGVWRLSIASHRRLLLHWGWHVAGRWARLVLPHPVRGLTRWELRVPHVGWGVQVGVRLGAEPVRRPHAVCMHWRRWRLHGRWWTVLVVQAVGSSPCWPHVRSVHVRVPHVGVCGLTEPVEWGAPVRRLWLPEATR